MGAVTVLLNAIPAVEFEDGLSFAQQLYVKTTQLLSHIAPNRAVTNWTIPIEPVVPDEDQGKNAIFAHLLGLGKYDDRDENGVACFGTGLKIFLHETGKFERGGLFCSAGQWGVEVQFGGFLYFSEIGNI